MQQAQQNSQGRPTPVQLTALALRGLGQVYDMNISATRVLLQTQARAASVLGWPDVSEIFNQVDDRARHVFASGAEQLMQAAQRANEAAVDLQRQVGRVVETQAVTIAENLQQGLEELGTQTSEGLRHLTETARQQADEAERLAQVVSQELREKVQESGEQLRDSMRRGSEQLGQAIRQGGDEAREAVQRGSEASSQGNGSGQPSAESQSPQGDGQASPGEDRGARRGKGGQQQPAAA
jgi:DNA anti-recombination protein RmuC